MSASRSAYLFAEAAAWPYVSPHAFTLGLTALEHPSILLPGGDTQSLAETLEEHLRLRARGLSLEALRQIRQSAWLGDLPPTPHHNPPFTSLPAEGSLPLHQHLAWLAGTHLLLAGDVVRLRARPDCDEPAMAERWRHLARALPPDLLIAALASHHRATPPADCVSLAPPALERLLRDEPVAQVHLHLGAAQSFALLWTHTMGQLAVGPPALADWPSGPPPFAAPREHFTALASAALARLVLATFLARGSSASFTAVASDFRQRFGSLAALAGLWHGRLAGISPGRTLATYRRASGRNARSKPLACRDDLCRRDPLYDWLGSHATSLAETRFLTLALAYLASDGADASFTRLFWQYVRVRCLFYRHLTQEPGTAGLDWFSRHFERIKPLRHELSKSLQLETALIDERRGLHLASLEVRTAPDSRWFENRKLVRDVAKLETKIAPCPELGLVLHFQKLETRRIGRRQRRHADPRQHAHLCRFGSYFHERRIEALALQRLLVHHPETLRHLRGLDVCNLELAVPTWVLLPLLQRLRRVSDGLGVAPLRLTLHVGEDFRRLGEGLRRIHEPLEFGLLRAGDRLGHAVALGVDIERAGRHAVPQPAEERLDDLLWELERYRCGDWNGTGSRIERVRAECQHIGERLYGDEGRQVEDLLEARRLRHQGGALTRLGFPFLRTTEPSRLQPAWRLLERHLGDAEVYVRGQTPISPVVDEGELAMLREAQGFLRRVLARLGVVIEANPASNTLIGELELVEHPAFRLMPWPGRALPDDGLPVALGDDDPVVFGTTLADEFAHLYFALLREGVSVPEALRWIDQTRRHGWQARFTLPHPLC